MSSAAVKALKKFHGCQKGGTGTEVLIILLIFAIVGVVFNYVFLGAGLTPSETGKVTSQAIISAGKNNLKSSAYVGSYDLSGSENTTPGRSGSR